MRKNLIIAAIFTLLIIVSDTLVQNWTFESITSAEGIAVTPFFNLVKVWNPGVSFGMLQTIPQGQWVLSGLALVIVTVILYFLLKTTKRFEIYGYSLVIAGALGNTLDRVRHGAVFDYLDFYAYGYHWPAFNITDMAIFIGVSLLIVGSFKHDKANNKDDMTTIKDDENTIK